MGSLGSLFIGVLLGVDSFIPNLVNTIESSCLIYICIQIQGKCLILPGLYIEIFCILVPHIF